jgi:hypothetical protein
MTITDLSTKHTYTGEHLGLTFEIARWGVERGKFPPMNNGKGCWNYYVYLHERKLANFNDFWLEPEVKEFSPGGAKYVRYDYYFSPLSSVDWHGGVTFWEGHNLLLPGQRAIQIGCDYSHLFDQERGYDYELTDVLSDCLHTIEQIHPLLTFK